MRIGESPESDVVSRSNPRGEYSDRAARQVLVASVPAATSGVSGK